MCVVPTSSARIEALVSRSIGRFGVSRKEQAVADQFQ
jgi:hypothetical protein